jgi:coenzyme F420-reducing hydrogenase delta subunit
MMNQQEINRINELYKRLDELEAENTRLKHNAEAVSYAAQIKRMSDVISTMNEKMDKLMDKPAKSTRKTK